jgi:hypothetical protein
MNNDNSTQANTTTPFHSHTVPPLELQAVGGAIRLGRRNSDLEEMKEQVLQNMVLQQVWQLNEDSVKHSRILDR